MVVGLFSGLYNLSRFFEVTWYTWYDEFDRENKTGIMPTALRDNTLYIRWALACRLAQITMFC